MKLNNSKQAGFTLIEMIIVVLLLGILAMVIIPQITVSTGEARLNTLRTNLNTVRAAVELYYHQHGGVYPGAVKTDGSGAATVATDLPAAFIDQLTKYTVLDGEANGDRTALPAGEPVYGPYIKTATLPENPYNSSTGVTCDITVTDVTTRVAVPADGTGWRFYVNTGVFIANDSAANQVY